MATTTSANFKNFIGGEWVDAASGETFESTSPATGETIGVFPRSGAEDVDRAVAVAKEAFAEWRLVPAPKRGEILFRLRAAARAGEGRAHRPDDARDGEGEGRGGRRRPGGDRHDLLHGRRGPAPLRPDDAVRAARQVEHERPPADRRRRRDHAVELPDRDPVVEADRRRSSAGTPSCSSRPRTRPLLAERFVELLAEAGLPDGRRQHRPRRRRAPSASAMVRHPDVRVITFTGSRETGVAVLKAAAETLKHVHLELGGKNAIIVMDDADLDLAVDGIVWSAFGTSGQRCTAASRVIVHEGVVRRAAVEARRARREAAARPGLGGRHRHRPGDQQDRAREDPLVHRDRQGRGREAAHRRRGRDRGRPGQGLLLPADDLRRRRRRRCGSRRRRSSARRRR